MRDDSSLSIDPQPFDDARVDQAGLSVTLPPASVVVLTLE